MAPILGSHDLASLCGERGLLNSSAFVRLSVLDALGRSNLLFPPHDLRLLAVLYMLKTSSESNNEGACECDEESCTSAAQALWTQGGFELTTDVLPILTGLMSNSVEFVHRSAGFGVGVALVELANSGFDCRHHVESLMHH